MDREKGTIDQHCDGCQRLFTLGDKIYIFHLWLMRKDFCVTCKDKVFIFMETLKPTNTIAQIS